GAGVGWGMECPELTGCAGGDAAAVVDLVVDEPEALGERAEPSVRSCWVSTSRNAAFPRGKGGNARHRCRNDFRSPDQAPFQAAPPAAPPPPRFGAAQPPGGPGRPAVSHPVR